MMGWKPHEVRAATLRDFNAALRGYMRANGHDPQQMSPEEIEELSKLYDEYPETISGTGT